MTLPDEMRFYRAGQHYQLLVEQSWSIAGRDIEQARRLYRDAEAILEPLGDVSSVEDLRDWIAGCARSSDDLLAAAVYAADTDPYRPAETGRTARPKGLAELVTGYQSMGRLASHQASALRDAAEAAQRVIDAETEALAVLLQGLPEELAEAYSSAREHTAGTAAAGEGPVGSRVCGPCCPGEQVTLTPEGPSGALADPDQVSAPARWLVARLARRPLRLRRRGRTGA
ncbi:hypothetical protein [Nocardioides sp.]|uniref:hypothetical protein n=1 Tax=Nocardioides sp. TaxID=35761 RepID=UPI0035128E3B